LLAGIGHGAMAKHVQVDPRVALRAGIVRRKRPFGRLVVSAKNGV
jgi:hypothetical protein